MLTEPFGSPGRSRPTRAGEPAARPSAGDARPPPARHIRPLCDRSWAAVERFVGVNLGGPIRLQDMAQVACASPFHFARRFRARAGTSPMDYVMERRIQRAKEALACRACRICAIAQDLGFHDQSHFCRTFSRRVGITPRDFRRRHAASGAAR